MLENIDRGTEYLEGKIRRTITKFNLSADEATGILLRKCAGEYFPDIPLKCLEAMEYLDSKIDSAKKRFKLDRKDIVDILFRQSTGCYFGRRATRYLHNGEKEET